MNSRKMITRCILLLVLCLFISSCGKKETLNSVNRNQDIQNGESINNNENVLGETIVLNQEINDDIKSISQVGSEEPNVIFDDDKISDNVEFNNDEVYKEVVSVPSISETNNIINSTEDNVKQTIDSLTENVMISQEAVEYRRITVEELLLFAELAKDDLKYIDLESLISTYQITTQLLKDGISSDVKKLLIEINEENKSKYELFSNSYIQLSAIEPIEKPENFDYSMCERIGVYYIHENGGPAFVIDKIDNKVYYGANVIKNKNNAEITVDLTDDILADVVSRIEEANLDDLDYSYISQEYIMARNSWGIAFECEEGIVRYYVYNATGEEPARIINCVHDLFEYAEGLAE